MTTATQEAFIAYADICGARWAPEVTPESTPEANDCPYGTSEEHVCYNLAQDCDGAHMCACEAEPNYVAVWVAEHQEEVSAMPDASLWYLYTEDYDVVCAHCGKVYGTMDKDIN